MQACRDDQAFSRLRISDKGNNLPRSGIRQQRSPEDDKEPQGEAENNNKCQNDPSFFHILLPPISLTEEW
jgi:hypothetical protein